MIWFTSDTHFGHENMLRLSDRPWSTVAQMNDAWSPTLTARLLWTTSSTFWVTLALR